MFNATDRMPRHNADTATQRCTGPADVPPPAPDVVPLPPAEAPEAPPEIIEPDWPGRPEPIREPIVPGEPAPLWF